MGGGKHLRISIFALALLLAAIAIVYLCIPKEPRYQGRSLSQWLYQAQSSFNYSGGRSGSDPQWQSASNALQNIGTNALPLLLKWISAKDSRQKAALISWINSCHFLHWYFPTAAEHREAACYGFLLLKDKAKPAWPSLVQHTYDKESTVRTASFLSLLASKADRNTVMPLCSRLIKDTEGDVHFNTAYWFHYYHPEDAEAAGAYRLYPQLRNEPTILTDTNRPLLK
jgi:hypothetical protein